MIENESENGIFQMYGTGPVPSLYTKYYRVLYVGGVGIQWRTGSQFTCARRVLANHHVEGEPPFSACTCA